MVNKKIFSDTFFTMSAICIINLILQTLIYPYLNKEMGVYDFGKMLYLFTIISVLSISVGSSMNNSYLVFHSKKTKNIFESVIALIAFCGITVLLFILYALLTKEAPFSIICCCAVITVTTIRYFSEVYFRLHKNFCEYFIFYVVLGLGYIFGIFLFKLTNIWYVVFLAGELLAVLYMVLCRRRFINLSHNTNIDFDFFKQSSLLVISALIYNMSLNFDRIIPALFLGSNVVAEYYVMSLIGKTIAILVGPINTILITYGSKRLSLCSIETYFKLLILTIAGSIAVLFICFLLAPWFIRLFYPMLIINDRLLYFVTIGQIISFASSILLSILLIIGCTKWQFIIQSFAAFILFVLVVILTFKFGITGTAYATIVAGFIKFCFVVFITIHVIKKSNKY